MIWKIGLIWIVPAFPYESGWSWPGPFSRSFPMHWGHVSTHLRSLAANYGGQAIRHSAQATMGLRQEFAIHSNCLNKCLNKRLLDGDDKQSGPECQTWRKKPFLFPSERCFQWTRRRRAVNRYLKVWPQMSQTGLSGVQINWPVSKGAVISNSITDSGYYQYQGKTPWYWHRANLPENYTNIILSGQICLSINGSAQNGEICES